MSAKKPAKTVKCQHCHEEFSDKPNDYPYPGKMYIHHGEFLCEDCLVGMGGVPAGDADAPMLYAEGTLYRVTSA